MTIGVELEFVCVARIQQPQEDYNMLVAQYPGLIIVPYPPVNVVNFSFDWHVYNQEHAYGVIRQLLSNIGLEVNHEGLDGSEPFHRNAANTTDPQYHRWTISRDGTLLLEDDEQRFLWNHVRQHRLANGSLPAASIPEMFSFVQLELISPALQSDSASFDEIASATSIIKQSLLCLTPRSSGFHVHIGIGRARFHVEQLRKLAAAMFCADVLLAHLHPARRQHNRQCLRPRLHSRLAHRHSSIDANARF